MEIYATELMGAEAYDAQGNFVGRVREFFIEPSQATNRLSHFLLSRGHFQPLMARHDQIATFAPGTVRLNVSERALQLYEPNESLLAVRKDLMDQQIIDTRGRKVVRVNDVDLTEMQHQRKCGAAGDASRCGTAGRGAQAPAGCRFAGNDPQAAEQAAAERHSLGIRELDRVRPACGA